MDKEARGVRKDRRVRRTEGLLHAALASLIHEKSYDAIVVKEILARADVGRSTFYSHFRDKDELLVSGIREMVRAGAAGAGAASPYDRLLRFSRPVFEHIERHRVTCDAATSAREQAVVHDHLQRVIAELVLADLRRHAGAFAVPPELLARHVAATYVLVLEWWVESPDPLPAARANDVFRALILPALTEGPATAPNGARDRT
jgi:AcrR family transcriptional regulator